jgi:hypothetical protein
MEELKRIGARRMAQERVAHPELGGISVLAEKISL